MGPLQVTLGLHILSLVALAAAVATIGGFGEMSGDEVPMFVGLGVLGALSYLMFYRALQIGPISIVSPIVSAFAAPLVVLAVLILDESLATGEIVAIVVVISGALLASADPRAIQATERIAVLGLRARAPGP